MAVEVSQKMYRKYFKANGEPHIKRGMCEECGLVIYADTEKVLLSKISIHNDLAHETELMRGGVKTSYRKQVFVEKVKKERVKKEPKVRDLKEVEWV